MPSSPGLQQAQLSRRLASAIAIPVILLLALGLVLGRQVLLMAEDAQWVDHSDKVIGVANDTLKQILDQETALRGYLVTRDRVFLEPLDLARPEEGFERLEELTADAPQQQSRFAEARRRHAAWNATVHAALAGNPDVAASSTAMRDRKASMDRVRDIMREALAAEERIHNERVTASAKSTQSAKVLFVGLLAGAALLLAFLSRRQLASIADTFGAALAAETEAREKTATEGWIRAQLTKLAQGLQGEQSRELVSKNALAILAESTRADVGALFLLRNDTWRRVAGHGLDSRAAGLVEFPIGEGVVGKAAAEGTVVHMKDVPSDYLKIRSGTGEASPAEVVLVPARVEEQTIAVVELGFLHVPRARSLNLLERVGETVGLAVRSAEYKQRLAELLEEAQQHAEELQAQQEELRVTNEQLEQQTHSLRSTQAELEAQQAELEQTNDHLVQQSQLLERQNARLAEQQAEVAAKARELERASQFKSDFLSNMSHELRTPLNSSLILAKLLADNKEGNLDEKQVKFAQTIYAAGNDLLVLINDILDLSKIEAGKMDVHATSIPIAHLCASLERTFEPVASTKGLAFRVTVDAGAPAAIETDRQRLEQILKNLIANAFKFTERGAVELHVASTDDGVALAVRDTGIGIPKEQQSMIFEAFRQADGTTNRKYGGTGLGLSISRELAGLLGGEIQLESTVDKGSTFTVRLPLTYAGPRKQPPLQSRSSGLSPLTSRAEQPMLPPLRFDAISRARPNKSAETKTSPPSTATEAGRRGTILVIEDDEAFAMTLKEIAEQTGLACVVATTARRGFDLAKQEAPLGIVLDMKLPDHGGLSVLDRLKRDPVTRHIPVHVISAADYIEPALSMGAAGYLLKPVEREQLLEAFGTLEARSQHRLRRVLVVDDDEVLRQSVADLLGREDVEIDTAASVADAQALLQEKTYDCVVTDLMLPGESGFELLASMAAETPFSVPPVIVYTGRSLTPDEEHQLHKYSRSIIIKGARSPERLLDEVTLFLHQVEAELPPDKQRLLQEARHRESAFEEKVILVAEDDVRNVFALTSIIEPKGARVVVARNGKEALAALERERRVDLVLMDVMMPEMNGLDAMRAIRKNPMWNKIPIIALTAKAMRDDQEQCLAAGANDYLSKPLDVDMLLSLIRVWMLKA